MKSKYGVFCSKVVGPEQIDLENIVFPEMSEAIRQVIRTAEVESLQGLLGDDWQNVARKLAKDYWGVG